MCEFLLGVWVCVRFSIVLKTEVLFWTMAKTVKDVVKVFCGGVTMKKLIVFIVVLALTGIAQAELMTANRGFEAGDTSDWMEWGAGSGTAGWQSWNDIFTVISDGTAAEGDYYAQLSQSGCDYWGYIVAWQGEATTISTGPGSLTMSAQVRSTVVPDPILKLEYWDEVSMISDEVTWNAITTDGTWQLITNSFTAPAGTTNVRAVIGWDKGGDVGGVFSVDYDAVSLVPEPMTIALLGLGGLFLRRRRA